MHRLSTSFVLGYHGCDVSVADTLLSGGKFQLSSNDYDWLGNGVYFWEANPERGLDFAIEASQRKKSAIKRPAVVGAVIDLGLCLDLTTLGAMAKVEAAYSSLKSISEAAEKPLPLNSSDLRRRFLDCAVITHLHEIMESGGTRIDTVRGVFIEGEPVYLNSGFYAKTHCQIAVRNLDCIKGVFRVPVDQLNPVHP